MGFQQGLSGLSASSKNLDVIGNNIANANTVGFKSSRAEFADIYAATFASSSNLAGIGTQVTNIAQQFGQGNISTTENPLDLAIAGNGFFRMSNSSGVTYSRNGQFQVDKDGYIVNNGDKLTGYAADPQTGILQTGVYSPLQFTVGTAPGQATGGSGASNAGLGVALNLDAAADTIDRTSVTFSSSDPTTFSNSTSTTVYDSLGAGHTLTFYFTKTAANTWEVQSSLDGTLTDYTSTLGANTQPTLVFNTDGSVDTTTSTGGGVFLLPSQTMSNGAAPLSFDIDLSDSTQYGTTFAVNSITNDGYAPGELTGMSVGTDGMIVGNYSNGQSKTIGQVVLANFANTQGLTPLGNNRWRESSASGAPTVNAPGASNLGTLKSAAVEDANVDLTAELVNLITAQRNYQANAQTIKAQDTIMQTLVNLG